MPKRKDGGQPRDRDVVKIERHDASVLAAIAKRETGGLLTRHERYLLAFEDADLTPEEAAKILHDVAKKGSDGRARVKAIDAMTRILGDEAPKQHEHAVALFTLDQLVGRGEAPLAAQAVATQPDRLLPGGAGVSPVAGTGANPRGRGKTNGKRNGRKRRGSNGTRRRKK